jgi:hypothetical protein
MDAAAHAGAGTLSPLEGAAFLLHDAFGISSSMKFAETNARLRPVTGPLFRWIRHCRIRRQCLPEYMDSACVASRVVAGGCRIGLHKYIRLLSASVDASPDDNSLAGTS